jgi:hypothetical protein
VVVPIAALTDVLAVIGAVVGTIALGLTIRREWLDRAKLTIDTTGSMEDDGTNMHITVTVENHGRQGVIIREAGFKWDADPPILGDESSGQIVLHSMTDGRISLGPGDPAQFHWPPPESSKLPAHADAPLRPYAQYSGGKILWGSPKAFLRMMMDLGWEPPVESRNDWMPQDRVQVRAKPVFPSWKIWKAKELRTFSDADPHWDKRQIEATRELAAKEEAREKAAKEERGR